MPAQDFIRKTEQHVRQHLEGEGSGHDWWHIHQVRKNALKIASGEENPDMLVVELAALLHDIADSKDHEGDHTVGPRVAREWLESIDVPSDTIDHICDIIEKQSFSAKAGKLPRIEGQIVQDADRLEAIGATGIARCFAYGGSKGREIYDPEGKSDRHSIQHFYDKLLNIKDLMNTETGITMAEERHRFMEEFLKQFYQEWK